MTVVIKTGLKDGGTKRRRENERERVSTGSSYPFDDAENKDIHRVYEAGLKKERERRGSLERKTAMER